MVAITERVQMALGFGNEYFTTLEPVLFVNGDNSRQVLSLCVSICFFIRLFPLDRLFSYRLRRDACSCLIVQVLVGIK